ncbi:MAG TPA: hypothetical protein VKU19_15770 [Bryobacteraceae bacterium]|nr:hypothetical protein [Bryobacteraceae bacterium]
MFATAQPDLELNAIAVAEGDESEPADGIEEVKSVGQVAAIPLIERIKAVFAGTEFPGDEASDSGWDEPSAREIKLYALSSFSVSC